MEEIRKNILETINSPADLKKVSEDDLIEVCRELREKIIDSIGSSKAMSHPGQWYGGAVCARR